MKLAVLILNKEEYLENLLEGFIEIGITGATIVNTEGMGHVLSHDIPIFAGLQTLINGSRPQNRLVLSVIQAEQTADAITLFQDVCGDLDSPATGIVFTIPIDEVHGLAPELGDELGSL